MRNVSVILAIAFSFFIVGFIVNFDEILRLHEGQVQVMEGGEWRCANDDIRQIATGTEIGGGIDGTVSWGELTYDATSAVSPMTLMSYDPNNIEVADDAIRQLAESGRICEVLGHQWQYHYIEGPDDGQKCDLCGKTRIRKWGEE